MSQPAASPDAFVPFNPLSNSGAQAAANSTAPSSLKVVPKSDAPAAFVPLQSPDAVHAHAATGSHGKPVITLQREGERVTGIRVECACGQVIELACSY